MTIARRPRNFDFGHPAGYILGRTSPGVGPLEYIDLSSLANQILSTGQVAAGGPAQLASVPDGQVLSNISGGTAVPVGNALSAVLDHVFGNAQGSILYRDTNANGWKVLAPGTSGYVLQSNGAAANPSWVANSNSLPTIANGHLIGNATGASAVAQDTTLTALLDVVFGATQGNLIYRDTNANGWKALGPGTSGQLLQTGGAAANPSWVTNTAKPGLWTGAVSATPTSTSTGLTTWANQGTATVTDGLTGVVLAAPTNGASDIVRMRYKAAPATPYTVKALIAISSIQANYVGGGICWYDGTAKASVLRFDYNNGWQISVGNFTNLSTFASNSYFGPNGHGQSPIWLFLKDDGTTVSFMWSYDGDPNSAVTVFSVAKASGFLGSTGYSNVGIFTDANGGATTLTLMSWAGA